MVARLTVGSAVRVWALGKMRPGLVLFVDRDILTIAVGRTMAVSRADEFPELAAEKVIAIDRETPGGRALGLRDRTHFNGTTVAVPADAPSDKLRAWESKFPFPGKLREQLEILATKVGAAEGRQRRFATVLGPGVSSRTLPRSMEPNALPDAPHPPSEPPTEPSDPA